MKMFGDLIKKHGFGTILAIATLDGYRRNIIADREAKAEFEKRSSEFQEKEKQRCVAIEDLRAKYRETDRERRLENLDQSNKNFSEADEKFQKDPSDYNRIEKCVTKVKKKN
jgi:hypothetical protein